ncbi:rab effector MyRIP isoform X1 [Hippoglossus stenolepis]|uniref:rab effector MyRIP isoform X1 n=1 Tax=Hippoglossus stenolepis TaxID=195615 RepID=UPI001FAF89AC|nr:rab effector MyRIP isoform X1 [Hippoglossus stenolepis]
MGRKLDLSGLTDNEAEHVLQVVQRDMTLRKKEEKRLSELKQELDEEGSRCLLLSRQSCFNQRCCIRCCLPFTFLLNPKRQCCDCRYNVCKACRVYVKQDKAWLCSACQKSRLLKTQSLEWFYTNVKRRYKRFGSAKVLKTLYRKHLAQHSALSELTEGSAYEESVCNEGSVCGSDSTFYRQSEEHSMAETLTVALRVAEEAIDEAISEAEFDTASQEKQDEAYYLREHRGELIDELAKTIVQKIINRRKSLAEMRTEYDQDWPNTDPHHPHHHHQSTCDEASCSLTHQPGLWRSHSAFSLLSTDAPGLIQESLQTLKKEGIGSTISAWKSVDRLDNAGVSSVLKSPDGNWIALQSTQLSRPTLLTQRKSLVYSALERESGLVSAYKDMDSDDETKPEPDSSWGAALQQIHRKMTDCNLNLQDAQDSVASPLMSRRGSRDGLFSDSEGNWKPHKPLVALFQRKVPAEIRRPSALQRTSIIDVNFNVEGATEEEEEEEERSGVAAKPEGGKVRRSRRKRKSKKVAASSSVSDLNKKDNESQPNSDALTSDTLTCEATTPEPFDLESDTTGHAANQTDEELELELQKRAGRVSAASDQEKVLEEDRVSGDDGLREERRQESEDGDDEEERLWKMKVDLDEGRMENERAEDEKDYEVDDEEMKHRLYRLVAQSKLTYFSSTDEELDRVGPSEGEWDEDNNEEEEEKTERLTYKLCRLEKEVRATQFSSTEDELDRVGIDERKTEEESGSHEELAVKVCRLANQVQAVQFSSTEDELDRAGRGGDGEQGIDEETLWTLQAEKAVQAAQLRDLASLVSASQFSSTEDELDRVEQDEGEREQEVNEGEMESSFETEEVWGGAEDRRESFEDLDVNMFDLRDESEETKSEDEKATDEDVLDDERQRENAETSEIEIRERVEDEITAVETLVREDAAETAKETRERDERKSVVEAEKTEEIIDSNETRVERDNQPEAKTPDNSKDWKFKESEEGQESWEASADSEEEDAEFDRIISSMLMMTLEDMQAETAAENERVNIEPPATEGDGSIKIKEESSVTEKVVEAQGRYDSEETGSVEKVENATEKNEQEEKDADPRERISLDLETNEAQQTCRKKEEDDKEQEEGGGKIAMEQKMMEEAAAECESKEKDEKLEETQEKREEDSSSLQEGFLSPEEIQHGSDAELYKTIQLISTLLQQRYSAVSLCSITTQVLKVLNATEELLHGFEGGDEAQLSSTSLPPNTDAKKLDQQFSRLEENVYVAAGSVFGLEAELSDLEECARGICSSTSDMELSFLEEQVASAAAKVQQSELQIGDISTRIAALKSAGLNVDTQSRFTKARSIPVMPVTLDSTRQLRRRLPAPPVKEDKET